LPESDTHPVLPLEIPINEFSNRLPYFSSFSESAFFNSFSRAATLASALDMSVYLFSCVTFSASFMKKRMIF